MADDLKPIEISARDATGAASASAAKHLGEVKGAAEQLQGALAQLAGSSGSATSALEGAFNKIAGRLAGGALVVGLFATIKGARDNLAELGDRADDLRLPAQFLTEMGIAAAQARVSQEKLNSSLEFFAGVSKKDAESAKDFYTALGNINKASVEAFKNADSQRERQDIVAKAYNSTTDEVKRAQLGLQSYNTDNERTLTVLMASKEALEAYARQAKALGIEVDESMIKKARDAQSNMNVLATVLRDRLLVAIGDLMPAIKSMMPAFEAMIQAGTVWAQRFLPDEQKSVAGLSTELGKLQDEYDRTRQSLLKLHEMRAKGSSFNVEFPRDPQSGALGFTLQFAKNKEELDKLIADTDAKLNALQTRMDRISEMRRAAGVAVQRGETGKPPDPPAFEPRPPLNKEKENNEDAFSRAESQIRKRIALTDAETATISMNSAARERAKVVAELEEAAKRANTAAGLKNTEVTNEQRASIEKLADAMALSAERLRKSKDAWEGINETFRYFGNVAGDAFDRLFDKTKSWSDFAVEQARRVAKEMFTSALMGQGAFAKMMGTNSQGSGVGGILGGLVSAFAGAMAGPAASGLTAGGFALAGSNAAAVKMAGGGMIPAGGLALVSEHKNPRFIRAGGEPITVTPGEPTGGAREVRINIGLDGANGDATIRQIVRQGVAQGMAQLRAQVPGIAVQAVSEHTQRF